MTLRLQVELHDLMDPDFGGSDDTTPGLRTMRWTGGSGGSSGSYQANTSSLEQRTRLQTSETSVVMVTHD